MRRAATCDGRRQRNLASDHSGVVRIGMSGTAVSIVLVVWLKRNLPVLRPIHAMGARALLMGPTLPTYKAAQHVHGGRVFQRWAL